MATFNYNISVTGDCSNTNSGILSLYLYGGTSPYTVDWVSPNLGVDTIYGPTYSSNAQISVTGTQDDSNKTFTLSSELVPDTVFQFFINGQLMTYGSDYTVSGTTLTINPDRPAPSPTDVLLSYGTIVSLPEVPSVRTGLSAGTYSVRVNDSTLPTNNSFYINIPVSSGCCCNILGVNSTTCATDNGSVTGTSSSQYSSTNFYLYHSDNSFSQSATTNQSTVIFGSLTAGTYYMTVMDLGGCTGRSQNFIIEDSTQLDFGLYSIPNSSCGGPALGKIYVTGMTGNPPYTYLWSNTFTTSFITGLTSGDYSVQITDSTGCVKSKTATVGTVPPVGFGTFTSVPPTCFLNDGSITLTVTGGTAPYYYSASTGNVLISYSQTYTLSGLSSGTYQFQVTDAGLCTLVTQTSISAPQGISSVTINGSNSTCSSIDGQITIAVNGGVTPYTYTLIYPDGNSLSVTSNQSVQIFSNLQSGTYSAVVEDTVGCSYMKEITLIAENKYTISTITTPTTCNRNNGTVYVETTTGYTLPITYSLDNIQNIVNSNLTATTFNNVSAGQHTVTVTDSTGCIQTSQVYVDGSVALDFSLYSISCGTGDSGGITAFISSGTPPFTYTWSDNVPGNPQEIQVSNLTAGTYSLTIIDNNGCSLKRTTTINCATIYASYQTYIMGAEMFNVKSPAKCGLLQMLNEGFYDLTSGNTSCSLISATYSVKVSVNPLGTVTTQNFFTSTSLINAPSDNLYYDTAKTLLLTISGINQVTIDSLNNQITIETSKVENTLNGQEIIIEVVIEYDIMCLT
jgi:hypothetical protein